MDLGWRSLFTKTRSVLIWRLHQPSVCSGFPTLEFDTWWTIGAEPGDDDGLNSAFDQALTAFDDWNNGGDFVVNTFMGGSIFIVPGANTQGVPVDGKVLLGL